MCCIICFAVPFTAKVAVNALSTIKTIMIRKSRWIPACNFRNKSHVVTVV